MSEPAHSPGGAGQRGRRVAVGSLLLAGAVACFASNLVAGEVLRDVLPCTLSLMRWATAAIVMAPISLRAFRAHGEVLRERRAYMITLTLLGFVVLTIGAYASVRAAGAMFASLTNSTMPLAIAGAGVIMYRDRLSIGYLVAMALAMAGVLTAILPRFLEHHSGDAGPSAADATAGTLVMLCAVASYAIYSSMLRRAPTGVPGISLLGLLVPLTVIALIPPALIEGCFFGWPSITWPVAGGIIFVGLVPGVLGYFLWNEGVWRLGSKESAIFFALMPPFTALYAWIWLHQLPDRWEVLGATLVAVGLSASLYRPRSSRRAAATTPGATPAATDTVPTTPARWPDPLR